MKPIFYFTDIHGDRELYDKVMQCVPEGYTVVFGGDAVDRGRHGLAILRDLTQRTNTVVLKGNHETLFYKSAMEMLRYGEFYHLRPIEVFDKFIAYCGNAIAMNDLPSVCPSFYEHWLNGGTHTLIEWIDSGADKKILEQITRLPVMYSEGTYDFIHASPSLSNFKQYAAAPEDEDRQAPLLWERNTQHNPWLEGRMLICGHTPVASFHQFAPIHFSSNRVFADTRMREGIWVLLITDDGIREVFVRKENANV